MHSFPGSHHCVTSNHIFEMEQLPKSIVVIGGGYIGVEIAQIMNVLGVQTTLLVRNKMLSGMVDQELIPVL